MSSLLASNVPFSYFISKAAVVGKAKYSAIQVQHASVWSD
jgi:hypothetical protein